MIVDLFIENQKLDLFGDENIQITSAVADISDITKNLTDYSRDFTVPASSVNNRIFKHYYNATIDNTFDARVKANASIYLNGVLFRSGKIQLNRVQIKKGNPSSYTLFFFGNLLDLSRKLKGFELKELDLSAFDHPFIGSNIKTGLESSLFSGDLIYSLFYKKQLSYNSDVADNTDTEELTNIAYQGGAGSNGVQFNFLRPSIKNIRIIEAIEAFTGITFSRDFFGRSEFADTFLWANNGSTQTAGGGSVRPIYDGGDLTYIDPITQIGSFTTAYSSTSSFFSFFLSFAVPQPAGTFFNVFLTFTVTPSVGFESTPYVVKFYRDGNLVNTKKYSGGGVGIGNNTLKTPFKEREFYYEISSELKFSFTTNLRQLGLIDGNNSVGLDVNTTSSIQTIGSDFIVSDSLPKIKIIDYLKGIFQMFKLVVIPTAENELYVNTFKDYYKQGESFDITKYVDQDNYIVERGDLLNEINYTFEEPSTIISLEFEKQNNIAYGNEESTIRVDPNDANSELIDGEKKEINLPFEVIIYDRLVDQNDGTTTSVMYAPVIDEERKPVNPKPHIHYISNQSVASKPIGFIDENDTKIEILTLNIPLHCDTIEDPQHSLLFSQELNEWNGATMLKTLDSNYHAEYRNGIFNIKRRNYKYKAYLPFNIITKITLDDILKIDEQFFRIDNFTLNLKSRSVDLELITAFDVNINRVVADRTNIIVDFNAQTTSVFVTNLNSPTLTKVDQGTGTGWLTLSISSGNVFFDFTENTNVNPRIMQVELVQGLFSIMFQFTQTGNPNLNGQLDFQLARNSVYQNTILSIRS